MTCLDHCHIHTMIMNFVLGSRGQGTIQHTVSYEDIASERDLFILNRLQPGRQNENIWLYVHVLAIAVLILYVCTNVARYTSVLVHIILQEIIWYLTTYVYIVGTKSGCINASVQIQPIQIWAQPSKGPSIEIYIIVSLNMSTIADQRSRYAI